MKSFAIIWNTTCAELFKTRTLRMESGFGVMEFPHIPKSDKQLSAKNVNDTRKIVTKAWIGKNGQDEYEMTIHFGRQALSRYAKGHSLIDCIPCEETMEWINIDPEQKIIEIQLK